MAQTVGILLFDDVEVLDFAGPFEAFSVAGQRSGPGIFEVFTIAERAELIRARNGLQVRPSCAFANAPWPDILVVPGGYGTRREMFNDALLAWVCTAAERADLVLSICTGSLILGRAGVLDGLAVTTHHGAVELLREIAPGARVHAEHRLIDNGKFVVAAGISSGIDGALYVVGRIAGEEAAAETASYMEYRWERTAWRASQPALA